MKPGQDWGDLVDQLAVMRQRDPDATLIVVTLNQVAGVMLAGVIAGVAAGAIVVWLAMGVARLLS